MPTPDLPPGWHSLPMEQYLKLPHYSCSDVLEVGVSPAAAAYRKEYPKEPSRAMVIGSAFHCLCLEEREFDKRYTKSGTCSATKKGGNLCTHAGLVEVEGNWLCGVHAKGKQATPSDRVVLTTEEYEAVTGMAASLHLHPMWPRVKTRTEKYEQSFLTEWDGIPVKLRPDGWGPGFVVDLKSGNPWSGVGNWAHDLHLWERAAFYVDRLTEGGFPVQHYIIAVLGQKMPHDPYTFRITPRQMELGRERLQTLWDDLRVCHKSGEWPGGNETIEDLPMPRWWREEESERSPDE